MEQLTPHPQRSWLARFQRLAKTLRTTIPLCVVIMLGSVGLFTTNLLVPLGDKPVAYYIKPALLVFVWSMTCYLFITTFSAKPIKKPSKGIFTRLKYWVMSVYFRLVVIIFFCLTIAVVILSVRLAKLFFF